MVFGSGDANTNASYVNREGYHIIKKKENMRLVRGAI
jgi:hypothetical protein